MNINAYWRLARFDKPAGAWLLLLPCWFGLGLAARFDLKLYLLFAVGAFVMRAAGCIINDIADRKFDAKVERTKTRPIASGEISVARALVFLVLLLLVGLAVLLQLPRLSVYIGLASIPLFVLYPFMKRITYWPQFFLGLTFNIGILVAYAAIAGMITPQAVLLYVGAIFWTLGYDTIYAHQDKDDDAKIGVKSTALRLGDKTKLFVGIFYGLFVAAFGAAIYIAFGFALAGFILLGVAALQFAWQVARLDINSPTNCLILFKSNIQNGLVLTASLLVAGFH